MVMTEEQILTGLELRVHDFESFGREILYCYKHRPLVMTTNQRIVQYINECPWFQDGIKFYGENFNENWNRPTSDAGLRLYDNYRKLLSYLGSVLDNEEFWLGMVSCDPYFVKYYNMESEIVKNTARMLS